MTDLFVNFPIFFVAISFLVTIHELGHYLVARFFGILPQAFSVGLGRSLWARTDRHGTVWQISAIPLGGYVRFADSDLFTASPLRRIFIFSAGPACNLLLALVFFFAMSASQMVSTSVVSSAGHPGGPQTGDRVISYAPHQPQKSQPAAGLAPSPSLDGQMVYVVERGSYLNELIGPAIESPIVSDVQQGSIAMKSGLRPGDLIERIGDEPVPSPQSIPRLLNAHAGDHLTIQVRDSHGLTRLVELQSYRAGQKLGIMTRPFVTFEGQWVFAPVDWLTDAVLKTGSAISITATVVGDLIAGRAEACVVSGPIGIGETLKGSVNRGLPFVFGVIAVLSLGLGIGNLFPLPVLDGGQIMVASYVWLFRSEPTTRAYIYLNVIGTSIILSVMVFALLNDLLCG